MNELEFYIVDVFAVEPFAGNQLAVFPRAEGLPGRLMQRLAQEIHFSETTFVLPAEAEENDFKLRIFTPEKELPIAGHPTVGTTYLLAILGRLTRPEVRIEEGIGVIQVEIEGSAKEPRRVWMEQRRPRFGPRRTDVEAIADMLSIEPAGIVRDLPLEVVDCGHPFLFVPLVDRQTLRRVHLRLDRWERLLGDFAAQEVFVFCRETVEEGSDVHSRMFAPALGIPEDPATGAASGPLGSYLVHHGVVEGSENPVYIRSEQGYELGRKSFVHIEVTTRDSEIRRVRVGGESVVVGRGSFDGALARQTLTERAEP